MNERMQELLKQATYTVKGANGCVWGDNVSIEKFAELIVRECASIAQTYMSRWPEDAELTKQIKQHFGITQ
jgi:hypothetical protein